MSSHQPELAVVMPVYNEEGIIAKVVRDWVRTLGGLGIEFELHVYDDGSRDRTAAILDDLCTHDARVRVHRKKNSGHGPTILMGYREVCDAPWIFQIDSDDEMKPEHFASLWAVRGAYDILIGERDRIDQPIPRRIVSAISRATVHSLFGSAIRDVNSPYRLMRSEFFRRVFRTIPDDSFAPNLLISGAASILEARVYAIPVPQAQRTTGQVSIRKWKLLKAAFLAFRQTVAALSSIRRLRGSEGEGGEGAAVDSRRPWAVSRLAVLGGLLASSLAMNIVTARDRDMLLESQRVALLASAARPDPDSAANDQLEVDSETALQLAALGYAPFADVEPGEKRTGVDLHAPRLAAEGINVSFAEWDCREIEFFRNDGTIVRRIDVSSLPNLECYGLEPVPDGFVFLARPNLFRLDPDGNVRWKITEGFYFHHDLDANEEMIVVLDKMNFENFDEKGGQLYDDRLVVLRPDGRVKKVLSIHTLFWDALRARADEMGVSPFEDRAIELLGMDHAGDFYHANSVQILDRDTAIGKRGNVLISLRTLDVIATIDLENERVVWSWGPGELDHQHHPQLLENGNVLIFDNGWRRGHSRVIEVDPASGRIVWEYAPGSPEEFFTKRRGGAYRLENGNTLITESDRGRAFEVTPDGTKVWQYWMPMAESRNDANKRRTLFRLQRLSGDELARLLRAWQPSTRG